MVEAVYLHIPFCEQKCRYCDFLSFGHQHEAKMAEYVQALSMEMALRHREQGAVSPRTIFIGGGTPSSLPPMLLRQLLQDVASHFVTPNLVEYTMEANPGTVTAEKLQIMRQHGVNRLSMGLQSDREDHLQLLGRSHTFAQALDSYHLARAAGFTNMNFDLMYGLPGQNLAQWRQTLLHVLNLEPEHLSLYQLKIEANTVFNRWLTQGKIAVFDDEVAFEMYQLAHELLEHAGYQQYEISNYAKTGRQSAHNQVYWRTADYLGLGLGAHSFFSPVRQFNSSQWSEYVPLLTQGCLPKQGREVLTQQETMEETVFMGLRMNQGVSLADFYRRYQLQLEDVFQVAIAKCRANHWLVIEDGYLRLTDSGRVLGNLVFVEFV